MLECFEKPYFPRTIQAKTGVQIKVNSIDEILELFKKAEWNDCRISLFGSKEIEEIRPNAIFIDLDDKEELEYVKHRIFNLIRGRPLVIFTGRGLAVVQPIEIESMRHLIHEGFTGETISKEFLMFSKDYLTKSKADQANHPSLKNCFIRVPFTINSKSGLNVELIESWDSKRVSIKNLPFKKHIQEVIDNSRKKSDGPIIIKPESYSWIENVLSDTESNLGERITTFALSRYLINVKKFDVETSTNILQKWFSYPSRRKLSFDEIRNRCNKAKKDGKLPVSLETIEKNDVKTFEILQEIPDLLKHNKNVDSLTTIIIENYDNENNKFVESKVITFDQVGYSKTKDLYHIYLQCYDCNNRGAGSFEPLTKYYLFHEKNCKNICYLTNAEDHEDTIQAKYPLPEIQRPPKQWPKQKEPVNTKYNYENYVRLTKHDFEKCEMCEGFFLTEEANEKYPQLHYIDLEDHLKTWHPNNEILTEEDWRVK